MKIEFFLPMITPTITAQQKGVKVVKGKPIFFEKPAVAEARQKFLSALAPHRPATHLASPVRLVVKFIVPALGKHRNGEWHVGTPDVDNLAKLFLDTLTESGFVRDDRHVASLVAEKFWGDVPGVWVHLEEIAP